MVAPLVGAWIEMYEFIIRAKIIWVAPLVGAWIEIYKPEDYTEKEIVAPLVGAWIEIQWSLTMIRCKSSRTPRGCVD